MRQNSVSQRVREIYRSQVVGRLHIGADYGDDCTWVDFQSIEL
jgi:hypothetical protein